MGCLVFIIRSLNIGLFVIADIVMWMGGPAFGIAGVLGIIAYFVGYRLSSSIGIAPRDYWITPSFGIFMMKLAFANSAAIMTWALACWILGVI